jgi:Fe2+ or Zn2+ uptake regulation protein
MIDSFASKSGYSPRGHQLEIYGLCNNCKASSVA